MGYFEKVPTIEPSFISVERRAAIGAQVIGIGVMESISSYLSSNDDIFFVNQPNQHAKLFFDVVSSKEYARIRESLVLDVKVDSNAHIARYQMGLTTKPFRDRFGNSYFKPNSNFIIATHYLEDEDYSQKLSAQIGVDDMLTSSQDEFEHFFSERALNNIELSGSSSDLREIMNRTLYDAEFYLEH